MERDYGRPSSLLPKSHDHRTLDFFVGEKCFIRDLDEPMESGQNPKSQHRPQMMRKNQNYHIFLIVPSVKFYVEFINIEIAPFMFEKSIPDFYGLFLL